MTVGKLLDLLERAINDGNLDPKSEILAATMNGALQAYEDQLMEFVEENPSESIYILVKDPGDTGMNTVFYTVDKTKEEENV